MTFVVDKAEWRRLSGVAFRRSRWGRIGMVLAAAILVASVVAALAVRALVASGAGGWDDPEAEGGGMAVLVVVVGVALAAVALVQSWYRANAFVGMSLDQLVEIDGAGVLRYTFRVRGDLHPNARNVVLVRLTGDVDELDFDPDLGLITLRGRVWHGLNPDVSRGMALPPEAMAPESQVVIPNCFVPDLLGELSRYLPGARRADAGWPDGRIDH